MPKTDKGAEAHLKLLFWNSVVAGDSPAGPDVYDHFGSSGTQLRTSTTPGNLYISLHTSSPGYAGNPTTNEISYTGYARLSTTRNNNGTTGWLYSTTGGPNMSNAGDLTFGQMTAGTGGTARFWGLGLDASSGAAAENLLYFGALALATPKPFTVPDLTTDATLANNDIVAPAHGLASTDQVQFVAAGGASIPAGLVEGTWYYVIATGLGTDTFRVSTTLGGSAVDITGKGAGYYAKALEKLVGVNDEPTIKAGKLVVYER